ncbi:MAG: DUF503 domain-containing protein [Acidimicrobiia bacterium]|nr:DUF503 domain-containing protein [Acidimicrobiia bacterium]
MHAAALRVELRIPDAHSLKEKRGKLKPVISELRKQFGVSVAEVDHQDLWQRATLGVALVAPQAGQLERLVHSLEKHLEKLDGITYLRMAISYLEEPS